MRFGRKARDEEQEELGTDESVEPGEPGKPTLAPPGSGPHDAADVEDLQDRPGIDLGSLVITPSEPMEMRLQVDENSGEVVAAVLVTEEGALDLRAFAAARGGGSWAELRPRISAEMARMGGTVAEEEGTFGTELLCQVPVTTPEGQAAVQVSRISGHEGHNWLLRATLMGKAAVADPEAASVWEDTIRAVVVRRGREAKAPGTPLPLSLPPDARPME